MVTELIKRVPRYYQGSAVMKQLFEASEYVIDKADRKVNSTMDQCLISTADTAIARWESIYGVPSTQDDIQRRRERVLARKRGNGTGTLEHLKTVIAAFTNGDVEIEEIYNEYKIVILFNGDHGSPPHMDDVIAAIDDIIPAHIEVIISLSTESRSEAFVFGGAIESEATIEIYP